MAVKLEIDDPTEEISYTAIISHQELTHNVCQLIPEGIKFDGRQDRGVPVDFDDMELFPDNVSIFGEQNGASNSTRIAREKKNIWVNAGSSIEFYYGKGNGVKMRVTFVDNGSASIRGQDFDREKMIRKPLAQVS
jgi:hypothetical protein